MLCKDCPNVNPYYTNPSTYCTPEYLGTCEVCGDSVLYPCDTYYTNDHGVICHGGCK
jgi:ribosomal protein S27E